MMRVFPEDSGRLVESRNCVLPEIVKYEEHQFVSHWAIVFYDTQYNLTHYCCLSEQSLDCLRNVTLPMRLRLQAVGRKHLPEPIRAWLQTVKSWLWSFHREGEHHTPMSQGRSSCQTQWPNQGNDFFDMDDWFSVDQVCSIRRECWNWPTDYVYSLFIIVTPTYVIDCCLGAMSIWLNGVVSVCIHYVRRVCL